MTCIDEFAFNIKQPASIISLSIIIILDQKQLLVYQYLFSFVAAYASVNKKAELRKYN